MYHSVSDNNHKFLGVEDYLHLDSLEIARSGDTPVLNLAMRIWEGVTLSRILRSLSNAVGMRTSRDIFNDKGILLIPVHSLIVEEHLELLHKHNIQLTEEDVEYAEPVQYDVKKVLDNSVNKVTSIFDEIRMRKTVPLADIRKEVLPIVNEACQESTLYSLFVNLQAKDDYTYRHNLAVGTFSTLLGGWLGLRHHEMLQLTTAALLHDVGKMLVPEDILNKPDVLTEEEFEEMKNHTIYGYNLLKETTGLHHNQALVALQHHERMDGSGYPYGITGDRIHLFSRIVAVADVFHAMTSHRVYRSASPFFEVLMQMEQDTFGPLDPRITKLFIQKLMSTLIGQQVELTDGRQAKILLLNSSDPIRPLVSVEGGYLDLSKDHSVHISHVL